MKNRKPRPLPTRLIQVRKQFTQWRGTRRGRGRIPESLWSSAVEAASEHGVCRTAKALGLNADSLKKHVESMGAASRAAPAGVPFVELFWPGSLAECIVDLEGPNGSKMRIVCKGNGAPDISALVDRFWQIEA